MKRLTATSSSTTDLTESQQKLSFKLTHIDFEYSYKVQLYDSTKREYSIEGAEMGLNTTECSMALTTDV